MTTPFPFQLEAVREIDKCHGRALVSLPMGAGKSLIALLWAASHPEVRPIVCVCPASVKYHWQQEAARHLRMRAEVLEGRKPDWRPVLLPRAPLVIVNYDVLMDWTDALTRLNPKLVILDEVQYIKTLQARRSRAARKLCSGIPHVLELSGTPLLNWPIELWVPLNILRPKKFPGWLTFGTQYGGGWSCGHDFGPPRNLDLLHRKLKRLMIRKDKKEILPDLPPKTRVILPVRLEGQAEYEAAKKDFLGWLRKEFPLKARRAALAERMVRTGYLKRLAAKLKLPTVLSWVDDFLETEEGKLILFAIHKNIIAELRDRYRGRCVVVDGSTPARERQQSVDEFTLSKKCRLFIGNIHAAGTGWNGSAASTVAFAEMDWVPGNMAQAGDRPHRIGQKNPVTEYWFVARGTIEENLCRILQEKQKTADRVLDGKKASEDSSLSVFDELCASLERGET